MRVDAGRCRPLLLLLFRNWGGERLRFATESCPGSLPWFAFLGDS